MESGLEMEGPLGWSSCEKGCQGRAGDSAGVLGVGRSESSLWMGQAWPGWGGGRGEMGARKMWKKDDFLQILLGQIKH